MVVHANRSQAGGQQHFGPASSRRAPANFHRMNKPRPLGTANIEAPSPTNAALPAPKSKLKIPGLRWWIIVLIFLAAVLNYVDRQTLSVLAPSIQRDLHVDDRQYANILNIFLLAYTVSYLLAGKLADRLGTRFGFFIFVAWWSVADMFTALARGVRSMSLFRSLIGLAEAGIWPTASKAVSEWFPARERALAIGLYTMGATFGATVAPYLIIPLAGFPFEQKLPFLYHLLGPGTGWKMAFVLNGAVGLAWLIPWLVLYRLPRQNKYLRPEELRVLEESARLEGNAMDSLPQASWSWRRVFTCKAVWLLLLARLITDPVWYFYQFWFSKYLNTERHFSQEQLKITWIVYAAAGVGSLLGGWLSGQLVKRGLSPAKSRLWIMLACAGLLPLSPLITQVNGARAALFLTVIVVLAALAWLINLSSLVVDVVPNHSVGTVFSVVAAGSTAGGIIMNMAVSAMVSGPSPKSGGFLDHAIQIVCGGVLHLVQGKGYREWFLIMAFLHPLAWLILWCGKIHHREAAA
jgi:MFS transporter, ACS family, aldohexuronate transporter